jgi:acyl-CoA synthetase (AMP-forming)/AMP-acid ligase II
MNDGNYRWNVGSRLTAQAALHPDLLGIATPTGSHRQGTSRRYRTISLGDLEQRSSLIAAGMQAMGIGPDHRIALLVRFGEDFIALVFALLKTGATLVLVDPGMGRKNLLSCLAQTQPDGFVAIPLAQAILKAKKSLFPKAKLNITVGRRFGVLPSPSLAQLEANGLNRFEPPKTQLHDPAAIIFTTGSTGPPKGVLYTHETFHAQIDMISEHYHIQPGGKDLSGFPLFGLFNATMGTSTILPDMDPTRPADVDPPRLLDAIDQWQINQSFGSPALWTKMGLHCQSTGRRMESLKLVLSAGAPVPSRVLEQVRSAIDPEGMVYTPYGATEALPVASIESREVLQETAVRTSQGFGTCVGNRFAKVQWKVIDISDEPISSIDQVREVDPGQIGELMVCSPSVTHRYVTRTDQNQLHKVLGHDAQGEPVVWHRMGDVGYLDASDRFWYCGRKSHRVRTSQGPIFTEPIEAVVNSHPSVYRSALVPLGQPPDQKPVVIVEPWPEHRKEVLRALEMHKQQWRSLLQKHHPSLDIDAFEVYPSRLPTDIRHNSKIFREQLTEWLIGLIDDRTDRSDRTDR